MNYHKLHSPKMIYIFLCFEIKATHFSIFCNGRSCSAMLDDKDDNNMSDCLIIYAINV